MTPPITREARDWLWDRIGASTDNWLGELLDKMPLTPDDGGLKMILANQSQPIDLHRFEAARQFAAAWLPITAAALRQPDLSYERANELGLAMADDLIRRLREGQT